MKTPSWSNAILLAIIIVAVAHGQAQRGPPVAQMRGDGPSPPAKPFSITRSDPALDNIISPEAKLVELGRGFGLTEAGLWIAEGPSGYRVFAGLIDNVLYKVSSTRSRHRSRSPSSWRGLVIPATIRSMSARRLVPVAV